MIIYILWNLNDFFPFQTFILYVWPDTKILTCCIKCIEEMHTSCTLQISFHCLNAKHIVN